MPIPEKTVTGMLDGQRSCVRRPPTGQEGPPAARTAVGASAGAAELQGGLVELRARIESGDMSGARALGREMAARWPDAPEVISAMRILTRPRVEVRQGSGRSLDREYAWLGLHAHKYPGRWLAILGDTLIASEPNLDEVLRQLRLIQDGESALLHRQPEAVDGS